MSILIFFVSAQKIVSSLERFKFVRGWINSSQGRLSNGMA